MKNFQDFLVFERPSPHSKYSPSAADRWMACAGSMQQSEGIPEETSKFAEEGTLAHSYCEAVVRQEFIGLPIPSHLALELSVLPDRGEEMHRCALDYVEVISYWLSNPALGRIVWWGLEKAVPIAPERGCFGTGDCIVVGELGAAVIDFKYGRGKNVKASALQLKVYAAGLAQYIHVAPGKSYPITAVVHQPRTSDAAKEHEYSHAELISFVDEIHQAIDRAEAPNATLIDGSHCFWCPARRTKDPAKKCPRITQKTIDLANENFDRFLADSHSTPMSIDAGRDAQEAVRRRDQAIVKLMALLPQIKEVVKEAEEEFMSRLSAGETIEGVTITSKQGNRKLNAENDEEAAMLVRQHFPHVDPMQVVPARTKMRTLTSLEKELGKGKLDALCIRPITKKVEVLDEKTREILDSMSQFATTIGGPK